MPRLLPLIVLLPILCLAACSSEPASDVNTATGEDITRVPPLIDRELFFGDPEISGADLSPDGRWVSFIRPYRGVRNIWVKGLDDPFEAARPVTADARPVPDYFWSRDGRFILYVQDKDGNEDFHVYSVDPQAEPLGDTGVPPAVDLTPVDGVRAGIYAVPRDQPDAIIVGLNDRDPAYHDVYRVDIASGARTLLIRNEQQVGGYLFDEQGQPRLAIRQIEGGDTDLLRVESSGELTPILRTGFEEEVAPIRFHPDGRRVYVVSNVGENVDLAQLMLLDPGTGEMELVESDPEGQVDFAQAIFDDRDDRLLATVYVGDRLRIYAHDEQVARDLEILRRQLPDGDLRVAGATEDMDLMLVAVSRDVDPGSVYLYDRRKGDVTLQYRSRPDLPSEHLASMEPIRYPARDGLEIPAYLTVPRGVEPRNLPVIIHPHGGPWARDAWGYDAYAQFLANRGYAVLQPNFRGSTGYGKAFLNAGNRQWGTGAMQHDLTDAVRYLVEQGIADPGRVAIFGGSYGGYATLAGVAFTPELYACAIPYVAPSNLITLVESFPAYWRPWLEGSWFRRVGDPEVEADRLDLIERSPLFAVDAIQCPLLVVHGANDPRVKQHESDQIVVALRTRGKDVEYVVAPDEGHGFRAPENRLALAVAMERFLARHLGGRAQEDVDQATAQRLEQITVDVSRVAAPATVSGAEPAGDG
ncbi:MAG: S9 family peptidase [Candidatus Krumholzibacteriia bacterium]